MERKTWVTEDGFELEDRRGEHLNEVALKDACWEGVDIRNSTLTHVNFEGTSLRHINFSKVDVEWIQVGGTRFKRIVRPNESDEPVRFESSDLTNAVFEDCNLTNVSLNGCNIDGLRINGILISELIDRTKDR